MVDFRQIGNARKLLGLGEDVALEEIKDAYRNLALKYHPDRCEDGDKKRCEEKFKQITQAKDIVMNYCANYRFSFNESDVKKTLWIGRHMSILSGSTTAGSEIWIYDEYIR